MLAMALSRLSGWDITLPGHGRRAHQCCHISCFSQKSVENFCRQLSAIFVYNRLLCRRAGINWQWQSIWLIGYQAIGVSSYRWRYKQNKCIIDTPCLALPIGRSIVTFAGILTTVVLCITGVYWSSTWIQYLWNGIHSLAFTRDYLLNASNGNVMPSRLDRLLLPRLEIVRVTRH